MKTFKIVLFGLGILLLLINIFGLLKSMRHADLYTEENTGRLNDVTIKLEDAKKQLVRKDGESDKEFSLRVNDIVSKSMSHSIVVKGVLLDHGIEAHLWDIAGHVVVRARVSEDEWYILDPDYGLFVPYDIEAEPEITRPSYEHMADLYKPDYDDPYTADKIVELYTERKETISIPTMPGLRNSPISPSGFCLS